MTKKDFIKLADYVKEFSRQGESFTPRQIVCLANFCKEQNPKFDRERWLGYIDGECGPSGGKVKKR
jgi:hypothetical protein